jgi:hypothetical protein
MISGFKPTEEWRPTEKHRIQWGPAVGAGFIAGLVLLLVPRGSPWSSFTFFAPVVMGRSFGGLGLPLGAAYMIHMALAVVYGLLISRVVAGLRQERAIITGGLLGLVLYVINFGAVSTWWPQLRGSEISVIWAHIVFGLISAAAYRGLLKRKRIEAPPNPS